jgi:hypothetical protein
MFKVGDEVSVKGEITKVGESGVVVKAHYFGEAYFDRSNMDLIGKTYEQGLADAWELAKKLANLSSNAYVEIFGAKGLYSIVCCFSYEEALAKIEAYEKEKEIKVGDVVEIGEHKNKGFVVDIPLHGSTIAVFHPSGKLVFYMRESVKKTGKHIDIESLLRQIGE